MAIASSISHSDDKDDHAHDILMPGFRFHPTEEELIEFYLRRKVEGKRFNVELIAFLDLYRYDPWELPALAAIGEKEWFFYAPRDRKYRNGDRPNRVTTSGYWKATGADRMIKNQSSQSIGRKKTLVFYSGKAPKGIRTSWIMNEYRLPQKETDYCQKVEISLCRIYKRTGVEDHCPLPNTQSSRTCLEGIQRSIKHNFVFQATSSQALQHSSPSSETEKLQEMESTSTADDDRAYNGAMDTTTSLSSTMVKADETLLHHSKQASAVFPSSSSVAAMAELHKLASYQHSHAHNPSQILLSSLPNSHSQPTLSDRLWEWNPILEEKRDYSNCK